VESTLLFGYEGTCAIRKNWSKHRRVWRGLSMGWGAAMMTRG
jgi:hypothetical protein